MACKAVYSAGPVYLFC